jgi:hypothetical protein
VSWALSTTKQHIQAFVKPKPQIRAWKRAQVGLASGSLSAMLDRALTQLDAERIGIELRR